MQTTNRSQTLFVGVDVHKDTHTAVALSPFGEKIFEMTISNETADFVSLWEEIQEIEEELTALMEASGQKLITASGCGTVIAAEIIGEVGDVSRFHSPGALSKYAGCAPREHSSGKTIRWRKTRSGNRV